MLSKSLRSAQNRGVDKSEYMVREEKVRGREGNSTRVVSTFSELQSARLCHLYLDLCTHTSTCTRVNGVWLFDNDRLHVPSKLVQIFATSNSEQKSPSTVVFKQLRSEFEQFYCGASSHWKTLFFPKETLTTPRKFVWQNSTYSTDASKIQCWIWQSRSSFLSLLEDNHVIFIVSFHPIRENSY